MSEAGLFETKALLPLIGEMRQAGDQAPASRADVSTACLLRDRAGSEGNMGSMNISRQTTVELLTEFAGFKAGVILTDVHISELLRDYDANLSRNIISQEISGFRFHSSEFDEIAAHILYKLGNIDEATTTSRTIRLYHQVKSDPKKLACYEQVMDCYCAFMECTFSDPPPYGTELDPEPFMR